MIVVVQWHNKERHAVREKILRKIKLNSAFTMMEMLIVVAIMVIFFGVSMLGISSLAKDIKMAELDEYAKTIYLQAQNQLAAKEVEGGLNDYYEKIANCPNSRFLTEMPHDYGEDDGAYKNLCYVSKADYNSEDKEKDLISDLIPMDSDIYQQEGSYLIELNPSTGDIYGVFYWEKNEVMNYKEDIMDLFGRSRAERTATRIGYYGGRTESVVGSSIVLDQTVEMINDEELYIRIAFKQSDRLMKLIQANALTISCEVKDESGNIYKPEINPKAYTAGADYLEIYCLLASMESEYDVNSTNQKSVYQTLQAGETWTVTVESLLREDNLGINLEEVDTAESHSLFGDGTTEEKIIISSLRHLRNLDKDFFQMGAFDAVKEIQITKDIDFNNKNFAWQTGTYKGVGQERPDEITYLKPIKNEELLNNLIIEGNQFVIKNIPIQANSANAGLFSATVDVDIQNLFIEDVNLQTEQSNVGALVGHMTRGSVINCGVRLSTYKLDEEFQTEKYHCLVTCLEKREAELTDDERELLCHDNYMAHRYDTYKVTGTSNIGGLIGAANGVVINGCYGAVKVEGESSGIGGLIGSANQVTLVESYASGDVVGNRQVGGCIGKANATSVVDTYAVGDIDGEDAYGGFVGYSKNSTYKNCTAYGKITIPANAQGITPTDKAGGFINKTDSENSTYTNCSYMSQPGYNNLETNVVIMSPSGVGIKSYSQLLATTNNGIASGNTYSYDATLFGQTYPFYILPNQTTYYGDWAMPYIIDNALVYYEKYADGSYGYYCITKIADSSYWWKLDTLDNENQKTILEDGYGILTKYYIDQMTMDVYVGSGSSKLSLSGYSRETDTNEDGSKDDLGYVFEVSDKEEAGKVVRLLQQGALSFHAYATENYDEKLGETKPDALPLNDTITVSGLYLYRLPYQLQCTERYNIDNFYDKLIIRRAYLAGTNMSVIGGEDKDGKETQVPFFYSPHFAKTARNDSGADSLTSPNTAYIRSARHLNALGRYPYYWNNKGGNGNMIYLQERDINFSTYGGVLDGNGMLIPGVKQYCGIPYDLQDVDADYANQPIGDPNRTKTLADGSRVNYAQFQNVYDGGCYQIIDFALKSDRQFVGLFGEITNATIRNVVMTVSPEVKDAGYTGNGGKIISTCRTHGVAFLDWTIRTGLGSMVGLAFKDGNIIENCASAGYEVEYQFQDNNVELSAVGGLIGFSMSRVTNCSAVNDVSIVLMNQNAANDIHLFVAGLIGSHMYEEVSNSYAGGTIDIRPSGNHSYSVGNVVVGGVTAGGLYISGASHDKEDTSWRNLYSYTKLLTSVRSSSNESINRIYTTASRHYYRNGWIVGNNIDNNSYSNCYYLDTSYRDLSITTTYNIGTSTSYAGLSGNLSGFVSTQDRGLVHSYPVDMFLYDEVYPFPPVVKNAAGEYVHYGDWPVNTEKITGSYPVYYEKYFDVTTGIESYGFYYVKEDGTIENMLAQELTKKVIESGYGELQIVKEETEELLTTTISDCTFYLYSREVNTDKAVINDKLEYPYVQAEVYKGRVYEITTPVVKDLYINTNYAAAISTSENLGKAEELPLLVRSRMQFENLSDLQSLNGTNVYVKQNHVLFMEEGHTPVSIHAGIVYDGGNLDGYVIQNAIATIFESNMGTIQNMTVVNSNITGVTRAAAFINTNMGAINYVAVCGNHAYSDMTIQGEAVYGFVTDNMGQITNSFVTGTVSGTQEAAGFAGNNMGIIQTSYANTITSALADTGKAAGFVMASHTESPMITKCYATGMVNALHAYGFTENGVVENCYTVANVVGANSYGFAGSANPEDYTACYWGYDIGMNHNIAIADNGVGIRRSLYFIQHKLIDYVAGDSAVPYTETLGTIYPYPSVGMIHYGDWPVSSNQSIENIEVYIDTDQYAGIFYYEKYGEQDYGVFAKGFPTQNNSVKDAVVLVNSLSVEKTVIEQGYGVLFSDSDWTMSTDNNGHHAVNPASFQINGSIVLDEIPAELGYKLYIIQIGAEENFSRYLHFSNGNNGRIVSISLSELP